MQRIFVPDKDEQGIKVPFYEDARADYAPYYDVKSNLKEAEGMVLAELAKLGAGGFFEYGYFKRGAEIRYGCELRFSYRSGNGLIRVAGLPMRGGVTKLKIEKVRVQTLRNLADWFKTAVTFEIFSDQGVALVPFMLIDGPQGQTTVRDALFKEGALPQLTSGVVNGEVVE